MITTMGLLIVYFLLFLLTSPISPLVQPSFLRLSTPRHPVSFLCAADKAGEDNEKSTMAKEQNILTKFDTRALLKSLEWNGWSQGKEKRATPASEQNLPYAPPRDAPERTPVSSPTSPSPDPARPPLSSMINVDAFLQSNNGEDVASSDLGVRNEVVKKQPSTVSDSVQLTSWSDFVSSLRSPAQPDVVGDVESLLVNVTRNLDTFIGEASSSNLLSVLIKESTKTIMTNRGGLKAASESIIAAAEKNAQDLGLDLSSTADQARATAQYTGEIVEVSSDEECSNEQYISGPERFDAVY